MSDPPVPAALDALTAELYLALRDIARRERRRVGRPQTLQTTALIHEGYIKLQRSGGWANREHFLASAATAMRHVLLDAARARMAEKRGDGRAPVPLDDALHVADEHSDGELLRIDEALEALRARDARMAQIVDCRFFAGYSEVETARILGISDRTVRRDWLQAKAFLFRALSEGA